MATAQEQVEKLKTAPAEFQAAAKRILAKKPRPTDILWAEPHRVFTARGLKPDPWQIEFAKQIFTENGILALCSRQAGKSESDAALTLLTILLRPPALVLFLSKTFRQAQELLRWKFMPMYEAWRKHCPMKPGKDNELSKEFVNGSRIVVLPDEEGNIRAFSSVSLIVIDEASRVSDRLYHSVRPMLAVSRGRIVASTTAYGQRGWFYKEWTEPSQDWKKFNVTADKVSRLSRSFLEHERLSMGDRWYSQEYLNSFESAVGSVFSPEDIAASFGRVSEEEAWADLFGVQVPQPNIVEAKTLEL